MEPVGDGSVTDKPEQASNSVSLLDESPLLLKTDTDSDLEPPLFVSEDEDNEFSGNRVVLDNKGTRSLISSLVDELQGQEDNTVDGACLTTEERLHKDGSSSTSITESNDFSLSSPLLERDDHDDDINLPNDEEWKTQQRHVFILSESGKPIYSRFGNEDKLVTLFGLMQALVSVVQDDDDTIRSICIGKVRVVFLIKSPLILVGVSRLGQSIPQIQTQLMYFYNQVVSILTLKQLEKIYETRRNYDLRRLLAGSERLLTALSDSIDTDPSFLLGAVKCLPLANTTRDTIANTIIQYTTKLKDVVFAILIAGNQLVTLVRMKKCFMHPMDLLIIRNLVNASESFKTGENWTPLCLPRFDGTGFVHAHVSYLTDECEACLILLTVDRDSFFALSEAKQKIVEKLSSTNCLESISTAMQNSWPTMSVVSIPQIRHFIYKSKHIAQFTSPNLTLPFITSPENPPQGETRESTLAVGSAPPTETFARLFSAYSRIHARLHSQSRPLRLLYAVGDKENYMGWVTSTFELYLAFEPFTKKSVAIVGVEKLLKWVKKEEDRLFITNSPTF